MIDKLKELADRNLRLSGTQLIVVILLCFLIAAGSFMIYVVSKPQKLNKIELIDTDLKKDKKSISIKIHVAGEVYSPGLYSVEKGSRVNDAITAAGGGLPSADLNSLNLAEKITDGQKIFVPVIDTRTISVDGQKNTFDQTDSAEGKISINRASTDELESLDGIGPVLAARIVDYREKNGSFKKSDQLLKVSGIGTKKLETIEEQIVVD